jgi:hypothetical protein
MDPEQIRNIVPLDTVREDLKTHLAVEHIKGLAEITEISGEEYEKMKQEEFEAKQAEEAMKKAAEELKEKEETAKEPEIIKVTADDETPSEENK